MEKGGTGGVTECYGTVVIIVRQISSFPTHLFERFDGVL
jgi:hypothetical protein